MGTKTTFLELTLPDNGEYVDNWDTVVNNNFEDLDDHLSDLHDDLVGSTGDTSNLKGSAASLQERIDEGLNSDGTPNLDNAPDFEALTRSEVYPVGSSSDQGKKIRQRFNSAEIEVAGLRHVSDLNRYNATGDPEAICGIAKLAAQYQDVSAGIQSPVRGFTPNTVVAGPVTGSAPNYLSQSSNEITIKNGTIINIDGFYFEIDGDMTVDFTDDINGIAGPTTYYLFASRLSSDYSGFDLTSIYGNSLGGTYAIDQRIIPAHANQRNASPSNPSTGTVVNTNLDRFTTTGNAFSSYNVRPGDILRIVSTANSMNGDYIVKTVVDDNNLDIFGEFQLPPGATSVTSQQHYIWRPITPVLGISSTNNYAAGRVYIGEVDITASAITAMRMYAIGGIHDTGWVACDSATFAGSFVDHYLGVAPKQVDVWFRGDTPTRYLLNPSSAIDIQYADEVGGTTWAVTTTPIQGYQVVANASQFKLQLINPQTATSWFYDFTGGSPAHITTSTSTWDIRVILRR